MSNYILNINKNRLTTTPQIVGRVADLPESPIDVQVLDGDKPVDLTNAIVEFRGVTPTDKKIVVTSGITVTNKVTGSFTFTFPKNFYTSPGRFKRAYFVIKRGERRDSTQDLIIHVIESIDFDLDESEDIIEGLDQVIKEVTDKMNKETQAMIDAIQKEYDNLEKLLNQQAQNNIDKIDKEIKIAIDESKLRMRQLESEYRGVINNAQSTLNQLNKEMDEIKPYIDETNKLIDKMDTRLKELEKEINDNDLVKRPEFLNLRNKVDNIKIGQRNYFSREVSNYQTDGIYMYREMPSGVKNFSIKPKKDDIIKKSVFIGFTTTGKNSEDEVIWGIREGELIRSDIQIKHLNYLSVYPKSQETLDWLYDNYLIKFEIGNRPTDWSPAPEDLATKVDVEGLQKQIDEMDVSTGLEDRLNEKIRIVDNKTIANKSEISTLDTSVKNNGSSIKQIQGDLNSTNNNVSAIKSKSDKNENDISNINKDLPTLKQSVSNNTSAIAISKNDIINNKNNISLNTGAINTLKKSVEDNSTKISQVDLLVKNDYVPKSYLKDVIEISQSDVDVRGDTIYLKSTSGVAGLRLFRGIAILGGVDKEDEKMGTFICNSDSTSPFVQSVDAYNRTYSYASNMHVTQAGVIGRSTSAAKYKLLIEPSNEVEEKAHKVLDIKPAKWFDKTEVESIAENYEDLSKVEIGAKAIRHFGFIADDFHEAGLTEVVMYDENNEVDALAYDRISMYHNVIIKEQQDRLNELEQLVSELMDRLE